MDVLKAQLERIQRQLAGLTATQKMLTAALVAIMAITVVWWGKYAGESEMVPLTSQTFSQAELGRIDDKLTDKGYRHTISADKILVPSEQRLQILSYLIYSKAMPHGTGEAMDEILKQRNVFDSAETTERIWNHGKEALLAEMIRSFPDVEDATVIVSPTSQYRVGGNLEPSATVNITAAPDARKLRSIADAAADAVSGAQAGLTPKNIKVVINGIPQHVTDRDSNEQFDAGEQLLVLQKWETRAEERIRNVFNIDRLLVSVTMSMNNTSVVKDQKEYDAKGAVQKELQTTTDTEETNNSSPPPGGEAATTPNTGVTVNGGGSSNSNQSQTREKNEQKYDVRVPETLTHSKTPAGAVVPVGATVRVPISYFVNIFRASDPGVKDPTRKQLDPIIAAEIPAMRQQAALAAGLQSPDMVAISAYVDPIPATSLQLSGGAPSSSTGLVSVMVGGHAKEIALGALALMSLFMASMMVRKGQPSPVPAPAAAAAISPGASPTPVLLAGEALAGEAAASDALLDAMELNDETIKAQQMVDQVSTMVRENPDAAATLVKRWLSKD